VTVDAEILILRPICPDTLIEGIEHCIDVGNLEPNRFVFGARFNHLGLA
jgi:hypothetical protein